MQRELVQRAQGGDRDAFSELAHASFPRLRGTAGLILRDPDRAQDAVQDALLAAWRGLRALRDPDAWDAWLYRLTVHACYRVARKERQRSLVELHVSIDAAEAPIPDAANDVVERDRMRTALARLDIDQRAVIVLHYYLDLPQREVARILGIPLGTVNSRLHRGLEAMRRSIRPDPPAPSGPLVERTT